MLQLGWKVLHDSCLLYFDDTQAVIPRRSKETEASVRLGTEHAKLGQEHLVSAFYTNHV